MGKNILLFLLINIAVLLYSENNFKIKIVYNEYENEMKLNFIVAANRQNENQREIITYQYYENKGLCEAEKLLEIKNNEFVTDVYEIDSNENLIKKKEIIYDQNKLKIMEKIFTDSGNEDIFNRIIYEYDNGLLKLRKTPFNHTTYNYIFDENNRIIEKETENSFLRESERFVYDENGVLLKKDLYTFTEGQEKLKNTVYYEYNKTGRLVKETTEYYMWDSIYLMEFGDKHRTIVFYEY